MARKRPTPKKTAAKRVTTKKKAPKRPAKDPAARPSALLDTRIIYCREAEYQAIGRDEIAGLRRLSPAY